MRRLLRFAIAAAPRHMLRSFPAHRVLQASRTAPPRAHSCLTPGYRRHPATALIFAPQYFSRHLHTPRRQPPEALSPASIAPGLLRCSVPHASSSLRHQSGVRMPRYASGIPQAVLCAIVSRSRSPAAARLRIRYLCVSVYPHPACRSSFFRASQSPPYCRRPVLFHPRSMAPGVCIPRAASHLKLCLLPPLPPVCTAPHKSARRFAVRRRAAKKAAPRRTAEPLLCMQRAAGFMLSSMWYATGAQESGKSPDVRSAYPQSEPALTARSAPRSFPSVPRNQSPVRYCSHRLQPPKNRS